MFRSLKTKFIFAFGTLVIVLFASLGLFLVNAKTRELSENIARDSQTFTQFTVDRVMGAYHELLVPGNFLQFNRQIDFTLRQAEEISNLSIVSYKGEVLYDYQGEHGVRYMGQEVRMVDPDLLDRVQSTKPSLLLGNGRVLYLKTDFNKNVSYVDFNEKQLDPPSSTDRLVNIVNPMDNAYAVIYEISYTAMEVSLKEARVQIIMVAGFGLLLTLMVSSFLSVSITKPLKELKAGALKIAAGDFGARVNVHTQDEMGVLAGTFNQMAAEITASIDSKVYRERVAKELELAADIQTDLLPKQTLELAHLTVAGGLIPATEIGGDAFDFIPMENGETLIYIGDGTGHGVPAGMMSSISNALLYALRGEPDLKIIAKNVNAVIQKKSSNTMFITMALTLWNEQNSTLKYLNAGHLPLLYFDSIHEKLSEIKIPGIAFGMVDEISPHLKEEELILKKGDMVVLYSDGIPDAQNEKKESYGVDRLRWIIQETASKGLCADAVKEAILADVMQFIGERQHLDDITVVVMKRK